MESATPTVYVIVTGEDPVAAGMLALDLVNYGVNAHGAADIWSAVEQLSAQRGSTLALVSGYSSLQRTLEAWRSVRAEGLEVAHVAVVDPTEQVAAQAASMAGDWLGVVHRPVDVSHIVSLLSQLGGQGQEQLSGSLRGASIAGLLEQELLASRREPARGNVTIHLESRGRVGVICLRHGQMVHAQAEEDRGRHALERILCWKIGSYRLVHQDDTVEQNLGGSWRALLSAAHEYARRVDEARRTMPLQDMAVHVRWERVRPLPVAAEGLFRRLARGVTVRMALDGDGDDELEVYAALQARIRRGAITPLDAGHHHLSSGFFPQAEQPPVPTQRVSAGHRPVVYGTDRGGSSEGSSVPTSVEHRGVSGGFEVPTDMAWGLGGAEDNSLPSDLPEIDVAAVREDTPSRAPVLPSSLPETDSGLHAAAGEVRPPMRADRVRSTGWFGLQVGAPTAEPLTLDDDNANILAPTYAPPVQEPSQVMTHVVSDLQRAAEPVVTFDDVDAHYQLFSSGSDEVPADDYEPDGYVEFVVVVGGGGAACGNRWVLVAGLVTVAIGLVLVIWPGSPLQVTSDSPVSDRHRKYEMAVRLIDAGQVDRGVSLMAEVAKAGEVEAVLQLAVLRAKAEKFEKARQLLDHYINEGKGKHLERARRLRAHLFAGSPAT